MAEGVGVLSGLKASQSGTIKAVLRYSGGDTVDLSEADVIHLPEDAVVPILESGDTSFAFSAMRKLIEDVVLGEFTLKINPKFGQAFLEKKREDIVKMLRDRLLQRDEGAKQ